MAKLTGDIIKKGLHVWAVGYGRDHKDVPVELIILGTEDISSSKGNAIPVAYAAPWSGVKFIGNVDFYGSRIPAIFLGDWGIRPYNYDNRATQVFTTKEELVAAMELWDGRNPNFVTEEGDSIERGYEPDWAHYDYYEEE